MSERELLIDADVHEMLADVEEVYPYLPGHWKDVAAQTYWAGQSVFATGAHNYLWHRSERGDWDAKGASGGTDVDATCGILFDHEGVSIAILNGFFHPGALIGSYEFNAALSSAYNDWQADKWLSKDARFRGSVHVVPNDPRGAVREIERMADHPQIVQVFLPLTYHYEYGDPLYRPIFEAAVKHDLAVAFHHGAHTEVGGRYPRYVAEWHVLAAPCVGMMQLASLVFNGVLDQLPDLGIVMLETGAAWLPWFLWRADENYKEFRWEVPWVKRLPSEQIRAQVRVSTQPIGELPIGDFVRLVEMARCEDVFVFATDYPHHDGDSASTLAPALPPDLRRKIWADNALSVMPRLARSLDPVPA
jgi:predicted TIM-barrel fold metal-dependent hydrolase